MNRRIWALILSLAILLGLCGCSKADNNSTFSIRFLDVGQGDAALVECDGHYMLIDGGGGKSDAENKKAGEKVYNALRDNGVKKLDILAVSHLHADHIGGLSKGLQALEGRKPIGITLSNSKTSDTATFSDFEHELYRNESEITIVAPGDVFKLGSATVKVLDTSAKEANDSMSTYESRRSLISNYIRPLIGDMKLEDVTPRIMDKYYRDLLTVKAVSTKYVKARHEYLTPHTVREIHKTLRNAFNQAVKWELMSRNPVEHATLPKEEHKTRDIWTIDVLLKALEVCDDDLLKLAINLAFSCSLRMGELLGLTWDCVDITPTSIELGQASIFVEKELQRVNRDAMADLNGKDIMFKFPPTLASTHTALVLKTPKTKSSVRKVFLPKTVAQMLAQRKADIEELKDLLGDEYYDFNLVFCSSNGKPIENQVINRAFNKLIEENGLPKVVFHSLRHSSITYKLKLNGGDMKSVQGDSGHAQVKMVADVYSHIIDDDRRLNAERLEAAFYSGRQTTPEPAPAPTAEANGDDAALLMKLLQNPEMAALLKSLAKTL